VPTQAERTEATRSRLVATARLLFAEKGFADTSTEQILAAADVSRGAMYHHFEDKQALFRATFEAVEADLTAQVRKAASSSSNPVDQLREGFATYLDQCRYPEVQRIVLLDGPTVLGWDTWHEIDERFAFGLLREFFATAAKRGAITAFMVDPLAHLLLGATMQAGMVVARSDNPAASKIEMTATFELILLGMSART
jgi:AcrR family transcriptional regulator